MIFQSAAVTQEAEQASYPGQIFIKADFGRPKCQPYPSICPCKHCVRLIVSERNGQLDLNGASWKIT